MSELQIGLLSIGAFLVIAVYIYGYWQQRDYRKKFGSSQNTRHDETTYKPKSTSKDALLAEDNAEWAGVEAKRQTCGDEIFAHLGADTDYVVSIKLKEPQNSSALSSLWMQRFDFGKSVNAFGLNSSSGRWERLIPDSLPSYNEFKIALQLVDRSGLVSEVRLMSFHDTLRAIGEELQADIHLPPVVNAINQAKAIDEFCADVDQMIGLNILPGGDRFLFGSEIALLAERRGLELQSDGLFHMLNEQSQSLFSLGSLENIPFQHHTLKQVRVQGLTLLLDVPRAESPVKYFDEMASLARELALEMRAALVDDRRVALGENAIDQIRDQVASIEKRMLAGKIVPGSVQALRLFS